MVHFYSKLLYKITLLYYYSAQNNAITRLFCVHLGYTKQHFYALNIIENTLNFHGLIMSKQKKGLSTTLKQSIILEVGAICGKKLQIFIHMF